MDSDDSRPVVDEKRVRRDVDYLQDFSPSASAALQFLLDLAALIEEDCGDFQMQFWLACCEHPDEPTYCGRCPHCRLNALLSRWRPAPRCSSCGYSGEPVVKSESGSSDMASNWYACHQCGKPWAEDSPAEAAREEKP